jgi:beta-lactamase class A
MLSRRNLFPLALSPLLGLCTVPLARALGPAGIDAAALAALETNSGGRLGVAVLDTTNGALAGHRIDERFPMCSTFKVLAVAATLAKVDAGREQLARRVRIEADDLLSYAPVTKTHLASAMSVAELCEAAITLSDNTAANLLLRALGGPAGVTRYAHSLGDEVTRLDRIEPDLNEATPADARDTTTPAAMAQTLRKLAIGDALSAASRDLLIGWMVGCKTGAAKLRAGLPGDWRIGDKTGSGAHGATNDVAVIWPAGRAPLIVAAYLTETSATDERRNAVHAEIGRIVARSVGG